VLRGPSASCNNFLSSSLPAYVLKLPACCCMRPPSPPGASFFP
jgi:hypothetical protein